MTNDSTPPRPEPARSAATQRMLDAVERHRAAERTAQRRVERLVVNGMSPETAVQHARDVRCRSPYLRLWDDMDSLYTAAFAQAAAATPSGVTIPVPVAGGNRGRAVAPRYPHRWRSLQQTLHVPRQTLLRAAALFIGMCLAGVSINAYDVYADGVRARPATITYVNAPIADVVTELRRRTGLDVRACNVIPGKDRVTLTLRDVPIDSILREIGKQDQMGVHWWWFPKTVLLQPRPNLAEENTPREILRLIALSYTTIGCRP